MKKYVFKADLNPAKLLWFLMEAGREFQTEGAKQLKERPPADFKVRFGTLRSLSLLERRLRDG